MFYHRINYRTTKVFGKVADDNSLVVSFFQFKFEFSVVGQSKTKMRPPVSELGKDSDPSGLK